VELLQGFALLLLAQSAGEAVVRLCGAPLPAPVVGGLLLLVALRWVPLRRPTEAAADGLLGHLSLLFVPVGVGVITHLALLSTYGLRMLLALVVSTLLGLAVTALVLRALLPRGGLPHA
jgi:holin-like protein